MEAVNRLPLIHGQGTPERLWAAWPALAACAAVTAEQLVPAGSRAVVVAPHPDDELLGCGGLAAQLYALGRGTLIVAVTDGEACHPPVPERSAAVLAHQRRAESAEGWRRLPLVPGSVLRLGFPDSGVAAHAAELFERLLRVVQPGDVVLATWRSDGHPDHDTVGRVCAQVAACRAATLIELPVWMWHWAEPGDPRVPWQRMRRIALPADLQARKRAAVEAHCSQLEPGPRDEPPVLPDWALARLLRSDEYVFMPNDMKGHAP